MNKPILQTNVENYSVRRGKVRDVYDIGDDKLVVVSTDRISAFDFVLPNGIPDKGKILTQISIFWMDFLEVENHLISENLADLPAEFRKQADVFNGRSMLVNKCEVVPFECIVRGFLSGSGLAEYKQSQMVSGIEMPPGLCPNAQFPRPIFTPSTKEETGHDINIVFREMRERSRDRYGDKDGYYIADWIKNNSLEIYTAALEYAWKRGILIADTKFEFGRLPDGDIILIDEVLTPVSSRFWPLSEYHLNGDIPSFDKQYVRNWLSQSGWDKNSPPPMLPKEVVQNTRNKYLEAYQRLTGKALEL